MTKIPGAFPITKIPGAIQGGITPGQQQQPTSLPPTTSTSAPTNSTSAPTTSTSAPTNSTSAPATQTPAPATQTPAPATEEVQDSPLPVRCPFSWFRQEFYDYIRGLITRNVSTGANAQQLNELASTIISAGTFADMGPEQQVEFVKFLIANKNWQAVSKDIMKQTRWGWFIVAFLSTITLTVARILGDLCDFTLTRRANEAAIAAAKANKDPGPAPLSTIFYTSTVTVPSSIGTLSSNTIPSSSMGTTSTSTMPSSSTGAPTSTGLLTSATPSGASSRSVGFPGPGRIARQAIQWAGAGGGQNGNYGYPPGRGGLPGTTNPGTELSIPTNPGRPSNMTTTNGIPGTQPDPYGLAPGGQDEEWDNFDRAAGYKIPTGDPSMNMKRYNPNPTGTEKRFTSQEGGGMEEVD